MAVDELILVLPTFPPDSYGGAERQGEILARALKAQGVDVTLVAPTCDPATPTREDTEFGRVIRFRTDTMPNLGGRAIGSTLAWSMWFVRTFGIGGRRDRPIYVFHARLHAFGPAVAARICGAPLLVKLGGGGEASDFAALRAKRYIYGWGVQAFLLRQAAAFVANGRQIVDDLRLLGVDDDRIARFNNGAVIRSEADILADLDQRSGRRFLYAGRLVADKRPEVLIDAGIRTFREEDGDMVVLGEGPERAHLQARVAAAGLSDRVTLPGYVSDVYGALATADFFVSASLREGQSNALLEAMSAGVIPIVADASGVRDVVEHGRTGFVVERSDPEGFSDVIREALSLPRERRVAMALAARRFADENIGIDAVARQTVDLMASVLQRRGGGRTDAIERSVGTN